MSPKRAALVALGAYLCTIAAFVHRHTLTVAGIDVPWGLGLGIACTYAVVLAAEQVTPLGGAWVGVGWAVVILAQQLAPRDSILVMSDPLGWSFTAGSLGAILLGTLRTPRLGG